MELRESIGVDECIRGFTLIMFENLSMRVKKGYLTQSVHLEPSYIT